METVGPEIKGHGNYMRAGMLAPNGCIYFVPYEARKVLCITGEGIVQTVGPELRGRNKYWTKGVLASWGVMYFHSPFSDNVLSITV